MITILKSQQQIEQRLQLHLNHQHNLESQLLELKHRPNTSSIKELQFELHTKIHLNLIHVNELKWVLSIDYF